MKLIGTIKHSDLEGGSWTLTTGDGSTYTMLGAVSGAKDGMKAEVECEINKASMGINMEGPQLDVSKISPAK